MSGTPWGETRAAVLAILIREADMDGLVTISQSEIGDELGITNHGVGHHIANLVAERRIAIVGNTGPKNSLHEIQLAEEVYA